MAKKLTPQAQAILKGETSCTGGKSFGCRTDEHQKGKLKNIYCINCHTRMGCSLCVQIPEELLCLNCHQWATTKAFNKHGYLVPNHKLQAEVQAILDNPPF